MTDNKQGCEYKELRGPYSLGTGWEGIFFVFFFPMAKREVFGE